jgi:hypothetical protein
MNIRPLTRAVGLVILLALGSSLAYAETTASVKDIPLDDAGLRSLDQKHLRLARKAGTVCVHLAPGGVVRNGSAPIALDGCNISQLDHLVAEKNDPALSAYHQAIRPGERYDQNRSALYWRTVRTQLLANHPELTPPANK